MKQAKLTLLLTLLVCFARGQERDTIFLKKDTKWFRFNIQSALIVNSGLSNFYKGEGEPPNGYTVNNNKPVCYGFNGGIEFLLGRSLVIKHLVSFTYDLTNSNFNDYNSSSVFGINQYSRQSWHQNISKQVQFMGFNYGFLIKLTERLKFAPIFSFNNMFKRTTITNGYYVESGGAHYSGYPYYDSTSYHNNKIIDSGLGKMMFLKLRVSYDINKYVTGFIISNIATKAYKAF